MQDHRAVVWTSLQLPRSAREINIEKKSPRHQYHGCCPRYCRRCVWWSATRHRRGLNRLCLEAAGAVPTPSRLVNYCSCIDKHPRHLNFASCLTTSQPPRSSARSISSRVCDKEFWSFLLHSCSLFQFSLNWARRGGYPLKSACKIGMDDSEWWQLGCLGLWPSLG